jgi:capsular polysaccharide biosynthesis protein
VLEQIVRDEGLAGRNPVEQVAAGIRTRTRISSLEPARASDGSAGLATIVVSYGGPTPELAQRVTDRLAQVLVTTQPLLRDTSGNGERLTVVDAASLPNLPSPSGLLEVLVSILIGIVFATLLAIAREYLDRAVYDARMLQHESGRMVLGEIPRLTRRFF